MARIAFLTVHSCPLARLGEKDAGGMSVYSLSLARSLAQQGFCVDIYSRHHIEGEPQVIEVGERVRVIHIPAGPATLNKDAVYDALPEFYDNLQRFVRQERLEYDLVHSHYWLSGLIGNCIQRDWNIPHVTTFHTLAEVKKRALVGNVESPFRSPSETEVVASADAVVTFTQREKDDLVRYYGADPAKVTAIPCGVNLALFHPMDRQAARRAVGVDGRTTLLFVGRIEPLKGVDILVQAAGQLEDEDVEVLIIGGEAATNEVRRLKELTAEMGLEDRVRFLGAVPHTDLPTYYNAADVLVMPSYSESFGQVAAEALACGTPVLASKVGGLITIVEDGKTGYLVANRCPDNFAERLEILTGNPVLRRSMGLQARASMSRFDWKIIGPRMAALYTTLIPARALVQTC